MLRDIVRMSCRAAIRALLPSGKWTTEEERLPFELHIAVNKIDVIPRTIRYQRVEAMIRQRVLQAGLPLPRGIHLVSSIKNIGVSELSNELVKRVRPPCISPHIAGSAGRLQAQSVFLTDRILYERSECARR